MKKRKKAISPVVSTVLLIVIVVILAVIIFFWARRFIGERVEKFDKPIESICEDVNFRASINGNQLLLVNRGNVPIYEIKIKQQMPGTSRIEDKLVNLDKGSAKNETISISSQTESVIIIPVLLGEVGNQKKKYTCPEDVGIEIEV